MKVAITTLGKVWYPLVVGNDDDDKEVLRQKALSIIDETKWGVYPETFKHVEWVNLRIVSAAQAEKYFGVILE